MFIERMLHECSFFTGHWRGACVTSAVLQRSKIFIYKCKEGGMNTRPLFTFTSYPSTIRKGSFAFSSIFHVLQPLYCSELSMTI